MSAFPEAASSNPSADERGTRLKKFKREQLIVNDLNRGVSVAEIAARFDVGEKRMRAIIREALARREPHPPETYFAIQVGRLNEALLVAYSAMSGMNLSAVDRVVKIVRELDRYHGFVAADPRRSEPTCRIAAQRLEASSAGGAACSLFSAAERAPRDVEIEDSAWSDFGGDDRPEIPPQDPEKFEFAPECSAGAEDGNADAGLNGLRGAFPGALAAALDSPSEEGRSTGRPLWRDEAVGEPVAKGPSAASTGDDRPADPPQNTENVDSAPEIAARPEDQRGDAVGDHVDSRPFAVPTGDGRPANSPEYSENLGSAPGSRGLAAPGPEAPDGGPDLHIPAAWRRPKFRMALNGVITC